jgi:hypothetical protein
VDLEVALSLLLGIFAGLYIWFIIKLGEIGTINKKLDAIAEQLESIQESVDAVIELLEGEE